MSVYLGSFFPIGEQAISGTYYINIRYGVSAISYNTKMPNVNKQTVKLEFKLYIQAHLGESVKTRDCPLS